MKKYLCFFLFICFTNCKKGDTGAPGNANVKRYTFSQHDFARSALKELMVPITGDSADACAWFVYLHKNVGTTAYNYSIPGYGYGNSFYNSLFYYDDTQKAFRITILKMSGVGELYNSLKVVRIYLNENVILGGRRASPLPNIDFSDYNVVKKYYNLPD